MAYTTLYRKWRPTTFEEVRGQDHIVRTLKNQITANRIGHAYLFCGTRGTGKTTVAKIFSRAVNCLSPVDGSPCNECEVCKSILNGTSVNVIEIDAASNNGVENIRQIREEVKYHPTDGKYRVYIIDEVHMLSIGAFNALLKTLEEPPEYVIFILATTEVHKIPITIMSRCQRYDFRRLTMTELGNQISDLLKAENVEAEDKAVTYIARCADGSSRDALSLLEQCVSFYYGEKLTYEKVLEGLGAVDQTVFSEILTAINGYDMKKVVENIDGMLSTGRDLGQFVLDFNRYLRNLLLIQIENVDEDVIGVSKENLMRMKKEAENFDVAQIMRFIKIFGELLNKIRYASEKRVYLETAIIRCMQPEAEETNEGLKARINELEQKLFDIMKGGSVILTPPENREDVSIKEETKPETKTGVTVELPEAAFEDFSRIKSEWFTILSEEGRLFRAELSKTTLGAESDGTILVQVTDGFQLSVIEKNGFDRKLEEILERRYNKKFKVGFKLLKEDEVAVNVILGSRIPGIEMEIEDEGDTQWQNTEDSAEE